MDRSLDDIVSERQRAPPRGPRGAARGGGGRYEGSRGGRYEDSRAPRYDDRPRDPIRQTRDETKDLNTDWVHDRYQDDQDSRPPARPIRDATRDVRDRRIVDRYEPDADRTAETGTKLRVDNLHYDLNEQDLKELFERIGPVSSVQILYDRSDRSRGTAYVTYTSSRDAQRALRDYNGANAYGQPIALTLLPSGPMGGARPPPARGLDERITAPSRSLFDRIDDSRSAPRGGRGAISRRSESPRASRRSDVTGPAPAGVDRYIPGGSSRVDSYRGDAYRHRSRSPIRRERGRGRGGRGGRRDERDREERPRRGRTDEEGRPLVGGRPRKTQEELDAEMEDYFGGANAGENGQANEPAGGVAANAGGMGADATAGVSHQTDMDDVDMIE